MSNGITSYPSFLGQQFLLALKTSSRDGGSRFLDKSGVRVKLHQGPHVGKRVTLDSSTADDLPAISLNKDLSFLFGVS